jgi:hypothetical protein
LAFFQGLLPVVNHKKKQKAYRTEMSIAAEKLPLPHRDVRKKKLPRRYRTAIVY